MIDLDDLKGINDRYGHPAGDKALKLVAEVIQGTIRNVDLPARIGGDEFLVMLPEADLEAATLVAQRMCGQITSISYQGEMLSVSAGIPPDSIACIIMDVPERGRPDTIVIKDKFIVLYILTFSRGLNIKAKIIDAMKK